MIARVIVSLTLLFLMVLYLPIALTQAEAPQWYYPMKPYTERIVVKDFGTLITNEFYKGKEALFPGTRLYGYHAAVDLDATRTEQDENVPVYAMSNGTIKYLNPTVQGYGGVIIQSIDGTNDTALYGHVKVNATNLKVGDRVNAGQMLTYLGNSFSTESGGERKHLHFAIHKGTDIYLRGHEDTQALLDANWYNPTTYLQSHTAVVPGQPAGTPVSNTPSNADAASPTSSPTQSTNTSWFSAFFNWLTSLFT